MIQRIQSIYLFLSAICMALLSFLPLGSFSLEGSSLSSAESTDILPLFIVVVAGAGLSFLAIFLFKNRVLQMNIVKLSLLVVLASIGLMVFYFFIQESTKLAEVSPTSALAILAIFLLVLALRGITKDEKLIKSMDRLR